ncbi:MAG: hypothetical protein ACF8XB_06180, partial [Planctomycetota bacterium JB042]
MSSDAGVRPLAPMLLFAALAAPLSAQPPTLSSPTLLPGDAVVRPAAGDQREPALAVGPDGVAHRAWTDGRAVRTGTLSIDQTGSDVYASRVGPGGSLLDPIPIPIDRGAGLQDEPRVAWNGALWLVTWHSQEPTQFYWAGAIRGVRVSPSGQVLDAVPIDILTYDWSSSVQYGLGSDGSGWLVAGQGSSAGEESIVLRRVAADGSLSAGPTPLLGASQLYFDFSLSRAGNVNLLTYRAATSTLAIRFDDHLSKLDAAPIALGSVGSTNSLGVASDGAQFLVAWGAYTSSTQVGQVRFSRLSTSGQVLDPGGKQIALEPLLSQPSVRVAWNGSDFIVSWLPNSFVNGPDLKVCRVSAAGLALDPGGVSVLPSPQMDPVDLVSAGGAGGGVRFAWTDRRAGGPYPEDVFTFRVSPALQKGPETVASQGAPRQTGACVVRYDQGYVVFYRSESSGSMRLVGQRLDPWGSPVDPEPFPVHGPAPSIGRPRADRSGGEFAVTWVEGGMQYARRLLADGTPLDPAPVAVQPVSADGVDVAALNGAFLAVGVNNPTHVHVQSVFGVRFAAGGLLDASPRVIGASYARAPRAAAHGGRWFVAWQRNTTHDSPIGAVSSAFVQPDGTVIANGNL